MNTWRAAPGQGRDELNMGSPSASAGTDITIVAHSISVKFAMDAAEELAKEGISAEVVNLRSIRPLDMDTVNESVKKTNHLITVEGRVVRRNRVLHCMM